MRLHGSPERERGSHGRATQETRRSPGGDPGAIRRPVAGAGVHRPAPRPQAPVRLLPNRRPAEAAHRARAAGRESGLGATRRGGPLLHRLGRARASTRARRALSADGDRVRPVPAAHRARGGRRPDACKRDLRARAPADRVAAGEAGRGADEDRGRATPMTDSELVVVTPEEQQHAEALGHELPATLPVLPLKETVVFPESMTPLAIGQERSIKLIDDVVGADRLLALVTVRDAEAETSGWDDLYEIGTAAIVHKMIRVPDGTLRILVQGLRRIKLERRLSDDPYLVGEFVEIPDHLEETPELEALTRNVQGLFGRIIALVPYLPEELQLAAATVDDPSALSALVVSTLRLKAEEKQKLLELVDVEKRLREVSAILNRELEVFELGTKIQSQVQSEMEKGQREFFLRQQMKAIQTELGEGDPEQAELEELRGRIDGLELPEGAKKAARRELSRLERLPAAAAEYGVIRTYLDWIATLPWNKTTEDKIDLPHAREVLDADHFDLEKVKDRIIEFLAVSKLRGDASGQILCFVGPPGVGKTSLGQSIARTLERKFARLSVGGVRDEAEIRGHRRTYIGAMPGNIIRALRDAESMNPVFMIDEIDKMGADFRGDPSSAMLEVLDPEQNKAFRDHYLDLPFDLSKVLFIC